MTTEPIAQVRGYGSVPTGYEHYEKLVTPYASLRLPKAELKWYDIAPADEPVPAEYQTDARAFLHTEATSGALDLNDELGFVVLHRCGATFYFLIVCTWRNNNELWQTVYYRDPDSSGFRFFERPRTHLGAFCVWELAAVIHEQAAWSRFLRSQRDAEAVTAYLGDSYSGVV